MWQQWFLQVHDIDSAMVQKIGLWLYQDRETKGFRFAQKRVGSDIEEPKREFSCIRNMEEKW